MVIGIVIRIVGKSPPIICLNTVVGYERMILDHHLDQLGKFIRSIHTRLGSRRNDHAVIIYLMTNHEPIGVIHNMEWIRKHMQNQDNTGKVKKWSHESDQKLFQAKVDRQLADDFRVISIALGQSQKKLVADWMTKFVHDFKRGVIS